jgi:hypothetical protein
VPQLGDYEGRNKDRGKDCLIAGVFLFRKSDIGLGCGDIGASDLSRLAVAKSARRDCGYRLQPPPRPNVAGRPLPGNRARIDAEQHLAGLDPLVVGHQQL